MQESGKRHRIRSFLAGSVLGGLVVLAAPRARRRGILAMPRGLAAFEGAPCTNARGDGGEPEPLPPVGDARA